jgi:glutathione S-transferase
MLTIHHLGRSQSERIVWLCEELEIPYTLVRHQRDRETMLAPPALAALHPLGAAPVIVDDETVLAESGAIVSYIIARHGGGRLTLGQYHPEFSAYLYWLHFANGNLQAVMGRSMVLRRLDLPADDPVRLAQQGRLERVFALVEARLGEAAYFAGSELTAADIMMVFSLSTMRHFMPVALAPYPNIRAYLQRIGAREGYRRAWRAGDPDEAPLLE